MIMLFFLISTFFGLLGLIIRLICTGINTAVQAGNECIDLHNKKKQGVIANVTPKLIGEQKIKYSNTPIDSTLLDFPVEMINPNDKDKTGTLMYVIVRKQPDETWTQSGVIESYEQAKKQLEKERRECKYPRLLKRVYI